MKIAIFASGKGSNAQEIIRQSSFLNYSVNLIVSNKKEAEVLDFAQKNNIETLILNKKDFYETEKLISLFKEKDIQLIVLAGFLWLVPNYIIQAYPLKIINIHPSLLPKYGGKGMYGMNVHNAVFTNKEKQSGITIHLVNQEYDKGEVLLQKEVNIKDCNSPKEIAEKVLKIEHQYFAKTIAHYVAKIVD